MSYLVLSLAIPNKFLEGFSDDYELISLWEGTIMKFLDLSTMVV